MLKEPTTEKIKMWLWTLAMCGLTWAGNNVYRTGIEQQHQDDEINLLQQQVTQLQAESKELQKQNHEMLNNDTEIKNKIDNVIRQHRVIMKDHRIR